MAASAPASASSPATADGGDADWGRFETRVKGLIPGMVGLTSMFTARHLPCPLRTLSGTLASVGFDIVTLRYVFTGTRNGRPNPDPIESTVDRSNRITDQMSLFITYFTSRLLHSIAPRLLSVAHDPRDPGASNVRRHECRLSKSVHLQSVHCA